MEIVKVSAKSVPKSVAGAISSILRSGEKAEVQAIGAGAANQAVKAIAIARVYLEDEKIDLVCIPAFTEVEINGEERTAIQFTVEKR